MNSQKIEALQTATEYIDNLKEGIQKAINYYQSGEEDKASKLINPIAEGIEWLVQVLVLCNDVINSQESIDSLNKNLIEIVNGFENEDYILISDIFEYEMLSTLEQVQTSLKEVI